MAPILLVYSVLHPTLVFVLRLVPMGFGSICVIAHSMFKGFIP